MKITKIGTKGINIIKRFEGFSAIPYLCPAKVWTIGYGATYLPNGVRVNANTPHITEFQAEQLLFGMLGTYEKGVDSFTRDDVNQNQFDALVSFAYNLGVGNLKASTLLKKVNTNPNDPTIRNEFMKWTKAGGRTLKGLVDRRDAEADIYFS